VVYAARVGRAVDGVDGHLESLALEHTRAVACAPAYRERSPKRPEVAKSERDLVRARQRCAISSLGLLPSAFVAFRVCDREAAAE